MESILIAFVVGMICGRLFIAARSTEPPRPVILVEAKPVSPAQERTGCFPLIVIGIVLFLVNVLF
jgi:hypothetical protein